MEFRLRSIPNLQWHKLPQWAIYALYVLAYLCLLPFFYRQTDVDTIGYIAAAEHYAAGDLYAGINGYWSPLLSWLLVPFLWLKVSSLLSIKLINLAAGVIALKFIARLARLFHFNEMYTRWCMLIAMPHLAMFSLCAATPDVLACMSWLGVLYYAFRLFSKTDHVNIANLAIWGAISYFAKYYHFYALVLLLFTLIVLSWFYLRNRKVVSAYLQAAVLFLIISGAWMCALYMKHGIFTPTTAGAHNLYTSYAGETNAPQVGEKILPLQYDRYLYTAWEYVPDYFTGTNTTLTPDIQMIVIHSLKNMVKGPAYFYIEYALFVLSLIVLFYTKALRNNICLTALLLAVLIYPAGYFVTTIDYRYLLFGVIACLFLSFFALQLTHSVVVKTGIGALLAASFLLPLHRINQFQHKGENYYLMNDRFNDSARLDRQHLMSSPKTWSRGIALAYQSNAKYYDTLLPEKLLTSTGELQKHGITWYLCLKEEVPQGIETIYDIDTYDNFALIHLTRE
jgi:hypothetical protein